MAALLKLALLATHTPGRVLIGVVSGAGLLLGDVTDGRSLVVMAPLGAVALLHGWGILTNWGGIWDKAAEVERRHYEAGGDLPLGRTKAGRLVREWNRHDDPMSRGMHGAAALIVGPAFFVLGVLAGLGIFNPT